MIKLWDVADKRCVNTYFKHDARILALAVVGDNCFVSGSADGLMFKWKNASSNNDEERRMTFYAQHPRTTMLPKDRVLAYLQERASDVATILKMRMLVGEHAGCGHLLFSTTEQMQRAVKLLNGVHYKDVIFYSESFDSNRYSRSIALDKKKLKITPQLGKLKPKDEKKVIIRHVENAGIIFVQLY